MLLRAGLLFGILCHLAGAADGPWARFFNQPAVTTRQGEQQAMSSALSSVFNPLGLKAKNNNEPVFPQLGPPVLLEPKMPPVAFIPCSVPLVPYEPLGSFFITEIKPGGTAIDPGMLRAVPSLPCK